MEAGAQAGDGSYEEGDQMRALLPFPNATPYVFHRLEPVIERLATELLPAVLDADLKT